ncbi:hypothetical protein UFOVP1470_40 [uncultured Caudovirales phage]|uniref:Uncharacterized protein n=1 Tax=uncultured Caudovirales phage TaxID=2100421 RepID=A0A6J5QNR2_9CAUD|nr:hypothetical protein UFOVP939_38 [uncultured Caudovirales phage]CAB4178582.1 hypothetical protein UFOVP1018_38 [uncultured Caudovirales phage]CAB4184197.1 hypothetical protein UFOVP1105_39 [uncultured Caudovirales phage]CAB4202676.1 hypothetical protein UFOVP1372_29 [uncultured Caudovirales phage]CAB4215045.1 hypothetical protein UFOVP1470_40 [uncultured Caudovirales phage]
MIYPMTARTMKEAEERNHYFDGGMPYLNAQSRVHGGYRPSKWHDDDRMLALCIKVATVAAIGGLICIIATIGIPGGVK